MILISLWFCIVFQLPILQNGQPIKGTNIIALAPGTIVDFLASKCIFKSFESVIFLRECLKNINLVMTPMFNEPQSKYEHWIAGTNFGTKADRILVVGAHWDTVSNSPGIMRFMLFLIRVSDRETTCGKINKKIEPCL